MITIETKILKDGDVDYLEFTFPDKSVEMVDINDASDNTALKSVFNKIIELAMVSDVTLEELKVDPSSESRLLTEVFTEYITSLNKEISKIRAEIRAAQDDEEEI